MSKYQDTICLRADTKQEIVEALAPLGFEEGVTAVPGIGAVDWIGRIVKVDAVYDEAGEEVTPAEIDERYHANVRLKIGVSLPEVARALIIYPNNQKRDFARA